MLPELAKGNEMFKVWRMSTIVFVFQLALGLAVFAETKSVFGSAGVVVIVTFLLVLGITSRFDIDNLFGALVSALFAATAVMLATIISAHWTAAAGVVVSVTALALTTCAAAQVAYATDSHKIEPWLLLFVAALPLGVGTALGGCVLLWRRLYASANVPFPFR